MHLPPKAQRATIVRSHNKVRLQGWAPTQNEPNLIPEVDFNTAWTTSSKLQTENEEHITNCLRLNQRMKSSEQ